VRECPSIREKTEPDAWTTFNTRSRLGALLLSHEKLDEAETLGRDPNDARLLHLGRHADRANQITRQLQLTFVIRGFGAIGCSGGRRSRMDMRTGFIAALDGACVVGQASVAE
jgi:hypothetical protein